ncbi:MAG: Uma2 family endonuclease [Planctomycetaceae bacterium]
MTTLQPRPPVEMVERLYTAADVAGMPSELPTGHVLYELDNGRLITMVPPGDVHGSVEANLTTLLRLAASSCNGRVRCGEVGILLWRNPDRVVGADVVFIAKESLPLRLSAEGYLETIPDIVVEVISKNDTKAYVERKISDYLKVGAKQIWIADPEKRTLTVHRAGVKPRVLKESDELTLQEIIPGFALKIADVFAE